MSDPGPIEDALQRAQTVLKLLPVAVAQGSADMRYVWVSQRYADWLGVPREQILGHPIDEILGAECVESMRAHIEAALSGKAMEREAEVFHKKLGRRWIRVDCVPTFDASGVPNGWIEAIADITDRRRTEERLRESQSILQSFYDSSPSFMGLVELEGESIVMLYANRAMQQVIGGTLEQIGRQPVDNLINPDEAFTWAERYRQAQREGAPVQFEYEHHRPSGNRWLRVTVAFVGEGDDGRPRFSFMAEEITQQKQDIVALQEANRSKNEFLAMLGHELRNPLSPIVTAVQILKLRGNGQYAKALDIVERQVQYLVRLVDDLLDVSRVTRGNIQIKRRLLRMQAVVAQAAEMVMPLVEQRRQHLDIHLPSSDPRHRLAGDGRIRARRATARTARRRGPAADRAHRLWSRLGP